MDSHLKLQTRVLVVDDDPSVLAIVATILESEGYEVEKAQDAQSALEKVMTNSYSIVLSDLKMPKNDGLWLLGRILENSIDSAVILMTGFAQVDNAVEALRLGAYDYLTKPVRVNELLFSFERALERRRLLKRSIEYQRELETRVREQTSELESSYHQTLEALVSALDARECETANHSQRVVRLTLAIAHRFGLKEDQLRTIARGALLHDIGKIGVRDQILLKPGRLSPHEWLEMRKHPEIGARILQGIPFLAEAASIVLAHQERFDGLGYPNGLKGEDIPLGARIFAVADTVDAITSDRPYRQGRNFVDAKNEISQHAGTQFDPEVVKHFLKISEDEWNQIRSEAPPE